MWRLENVQSERVISRISLGVQLQLSTRKPDCVSAGEWMEINLILEGKHQLPAMYERILRKRKFPIAELYPLRLRLIGIKRSVEYGPWGKTLRGGGGGTTRFHLDCRPTNWIPPTPLLRERSGAHFIHNYFSIWVFDDPQCVDAGLTPATGKHIILLYSFESVFFNHRGRPRI